MLCPDFLDFTLRIESAATSPKLVMCKKQSLVLDFTQKSAFWNQKGSGEDSREDLGF